MDLGSGSIGKDELMGGSAHPLTQGILAGKTGWTTVVCGDNETHRDPTGRCPAGKRAGLLSREMRVGPALDSTPL